MKKPDRYDECLAISGKGGKRIKCPVQCGFCCAKADEGALCTKLGASGCILPERERPAACNEYLCPAARQVIALMDELKDLEKGRLLSKASLKMFDGLRNMLGVFDNPAMRLKLDNHWTQGAIDSAREAVAEACLLIGEMQ